MSYIGSTPTSQNFTSGTDYFSGTGSQTTFTLTRTVNSVNDIEVVINNVVQQPSTAYTLNGTTITFTSAPSSGTNNIYVRYLATNMQSFAVPANSITRTQLDSNLQAGFQGRNRIINGHMVVDQRNAGASTTPSGGGGYTVDRWSLAISQASKLSAQQNKGFVTPPVGFNNYLGIQTAATATVGATDYFFLYQAIEGYNIADLNWGTANAKTVTLSFWAYSNTTGTFGGTLGNNAGDRTYPFTYTINSASTWEYKTITITGCTTGTWLTTNGWGIGVNFSVGTGTTYSGTAGAWANALYFSATGATSLMSSTSNYLYITGVQLEEGTTATSFEREAYSVTLQKCQRYYYRMNYDGTYGGGFGTAAGMVGGNIRGGLILPVQMRASPTWTVGTIGNLYGQGNGAGYACSSYAAYGLSNNNLFFGLGSGSFSGSTAYCVYQNADANSNFSAEL